MSAEIIDMQEVIGWYQTDSALPVTQRPAGTYTDGLYVAASPVAATVEAHVQPAAMRDVLNVPEGQRTKKMIAVYVKSPDELFIAVEPSGRQSDLVTYEGEQYEVHSRANWDEVAGYFKAVCIKVELS